MCKLVEMWMSKKTMVWLSLLRLHFFTNYESVIIYRHEEKRSLAIPGNLKVKLSFLSARESALAVMF